MAVKKLLSVFLVIGVLSGLVLFHFHPELHTDLELPELTDQYFGRGKVPTNPDDYPKDNPTIKKFTINVEDSVLKDLKSRLNNTRYVDPLDNVEFQYGFHASYLKEVVDYWKDKFDWRKQEKELNKFDHYLTQIEGINVHFIHQKPVTKDKKLKVFPLLMVHGWPGSIAEFTKLIPLLTTPRKDRDYVFEVICPSIPGYGFSEAPHQPGFDSTAAARIFSKLMDRLGFAKFYIQGGDWGSFITTVMAIAYPDRVMGSHLTMLVDRMGLVGTLKYAIGHLKPSLFMSDAEAARLYPFKALAGNLIEETGYFHIQATKPDTIGAALSDSPAGLAAYILEKFSTATNVEYRNLKDGGLVKKFTLDELLTNVMIYWSTNTIASSVRFYKENMQEKMRSLNIPKIPIKVPVGIAAFPNELMLPKELIGTSVRNLIRYTVMPRGGHFSAMEEPGLLSDDIWNFVQDVKSRLEKTVEQ